MTTLLPPVDLTAVAGPVLRPGDPGWREEIAGFNLSFTPTPALVVGATSTADVAAAVRYAASVGKRVAVQATGHGLMSDLDDTVLVTTRRMTTVAVDPVGPHGAGGGGRALARGDRRGGRARPRAAQRLVVAGRRRRLHHGRRPRPAVLAATASPPTTSPGSRSSPPTARSARCSPRAPTPTTSTCSGPCAAARAASGSSPRWSSASSRWRRSTAARSSSRARTPPRCCTPGGSGRPRCPRTRRPRSRCCACRPCRSCPSRCAAGSSWPLRFTHLGTDGPALLAPMRAAAPAVMDVVADMPFAAIDAVHMDPTEPMPAWDRGTALAELPAAAVDAAAGRRRAPASRRR